jgi:hypothetical protein
MANRANARTSTGPKTMQGRTRSARNALRHALSLPVYSNLVLCEEVDALAREIAGTDANAEIRELARRVAEAQIDLRRVRCARHRLLSKALGNPSYAAPPNVREKLAVIGHGETRLPTHRSGLWRSISPPCRRGRTNWRRSS